MSFSGICRRSLFFFFSSRRRHTRCSRDWSSDVCSSDLKPADDGEGAIVKLLDVAGQARSVGVWPAAYGFKLARRTTLVEQNGDAIAVGGDGRASLDLAAWGVAAARLFTPAEAP